MSFVAPLEEACEVVQFCVKVVTWDADIVHPVDEFMVKCLKRFEGVIVCILHRTLPDSYPFWMSP